MPRRSERLAALFLALSLLSGCGDRRMENMPYALPAKETAAADAPAPALKRSRELFAMDTYMELQIYGEEAVLEEGARLVEELESCFSVTDEGSDIYALNRDREAMVSEDTAHLLEEGLAVCRRTGGALDLTIYPVLRAWGFTTGAYRVPEETELRKLLLSVDYRGVALEGNHVSLPEGTMLDLGSVAKGYTGDRLLALFRAAGVSSAVVSLGGNVQALGAKPDGSPWRIGIRDPLSSGSLGMLEITDCAVITSGGYERYFEADGETYWHILDPSTGQPARSGLISVTVVGKSGLVCDGLSTALFVMGLEKAAQHWRESGDFEAIFVTQAGEIYVTEGLEDCFTPSESYGERAVSILRRTPSA